MTRSCLTALGVALLAAMSPLPAVAQVVTCGSSTLKSSALDGRRWPDDAFPIRVDIAEQARTALPGIEAVLDRAIARWNDVPCASVELVRSPQSPHVLVDVTDAIEMPDGAPPVYGYTLHDDENREYYSRAEIILNLDTLSTGAACDALDLQGLLTHELGHVLGLGHSEVVPSTMAGYVEYDAIFELARLFRDDVDAICAIYPCSTENGCGSLVVDIDWRGAFGDNSCAADLDCPPPYDCSREGSADSCARSCALPEPVETAPGIASLGLTCSASDDCGGPFDFCVVAEGSVCGRYDPFCDSAAFESIEGSAVIQCTSLEPPGRAPGRGCTGTTAPPASLWGWIGLALIARRRINRAGARTSP